jgi:NADH-quinone oxidoreductase subunit M
MPLSILIWLPAAAALVAALLPRALAPRFALLGSLGALGIAIAYLVGFDHGRAGLQHVTDVVWIRDIGVHYKLGLDGLNVFLVLLTTAIFAASLLAANFREWSRSKLFYLHLGIAESAVLGAFLAQDLILFVLFFDLMLIPFYFLTGMWGGRDRVRATTKLVIYTFVGSLLMLAAAVATGVLAHPDGAQISFALSDLQKLPLGKGSQEWIFLCFALAFLIKMPSFPFHGWMPDAYRTMPIPVLAIFGSMLSKVAAFGFLRIALPLFPDAAVHYQTLILLFGLASILYGSAMAFTTTETRLIVGYSSIAQLGFIVLGIFSLRPEGAQGALLQMVNHGIVAAPLFFIVALLAARAGGSEDLRDMGGIAFRAPVLAAIFLIVSLATLAMPGTSNFIGEFLILLGIFKSKLVIALIASTGVVLASVYMLRAFIRAMHNRVGPGVESREISLRDGVVLVPLTLAILGLALYPQVALKQSESSVKQALAPARALVSPAAVQAAAPAQGQDVAGTPPYYAPTDGSTP